MVLEKELKEYKRIIDLNSIIVKVEKYKGKIIYDKFFYENHIKIFVKAFVWDFKNPLNFKIYYTFIKIRSEEIKNFGEREIKINILHSLYKEIIKKNNLMI